MIVGIKQGRLMPVKRWGLRYEVKCDCGEMAIVSERAMSCGCYRREVNRTIHTKDGRTSHPLYGMWKELIARCHRPSHKDYEDYGGLGIEVCYAWRRSFSEFVNDMGPRPEGTTIERVNNSLGYRPGNCCWATWSEQAYNRRPKGEGRKARGL